MRISRGKIFALLVCQAALIGSCLPTFRDRLSVQYPEDGTERLSQNVGKRLSTYAA